MKKDSYSNISAKAGPGSVFYPKLWTTLRGYTLEQLTNDVIAGLIVGIVALPLAIAFAISSGVTPDKGLATAIVAGFLISLFGGSRVQIGGPTGAFVVIVYGIVERYGIPGLTLCTIMAGVILVFMGLFRLGAIIRFIPYPMTVGFTSGIAVIIFSQQIKDLLGLQMTSPPADFLSKWAAYLKVLPTASFITIALSIFCLIILLIWPRVSRKIPGPVVALIAATAVTRYFNLPVETIHTRFGALPSGIPMPVWPAIPPLSQIRILIAPAFTVAMLGAIESLLSATVADGMIDGRHRSNTELIAQGLANIVTPLFGGIPATGAIARTATNIKNGGKTPVAGIMHAVTLFLIVLLFGRWAGFIPLCVLATILLIVSYHMSEWHSFLALLRAPRMDVAVLLTTFFLTVLVDLTLAIEIGIVMSALLFMKRMTDVTVIREVTRGMEGPTKEEDLKSAAEALGHGKTPEGVVLYEAEGAFFFGTVESMRDNFSLGAKAPKTMILRMRHVVALDASGLRALVDLKNACARAGTRLILVGLRPQPQRVIEKSSYAQELGVKNIYKNVGEALAAVS